MLFNDSYLSERFQTGIAALESYGYLKTSESGLVVTATKGEKITIDKSETSIHIMYDVEPHFYMALMRAVGMKDGIQEIAPVVERLGFMLDCSRNAVAKPDTVKRLIGLLVLMGYDYLELYTEDTYELPDEPYFGYKRGRYSRAELEEIVSFADIFQMEMVPCMQTLAHMNALNQWRVYKDCMDIDDIMLVGSEKTYALIRKCLQFWKEICHTNRINIGTDEAFHLGRGRYLENHEYETGHKIYLKHLKKVFEMCKEEGLQPEFWGDALYNAQPDDEELKALFDGTQTPIYWDYVKLDTAYHKEKLERLKKIAGKVSYAGSFRKFIGYVPQNEYSNQVMDAAFEAVKTCGVTDVLMTTWGDDGNTCSVFATIPCMWHAVELLFPCEMDANKILHELTGYEIKEWETIEGLNHATSEWTQKSNAAQYLLHNDFLIGLLDHHVPDEAGEVYQKRLPVFRALASRESRFSYLFQTYRDLCQVLIEKATFGKRLYQAYQKNDLSTMKQMLQELESIHVNLKQFYDSYRIQWMKENKGFGFEVLDVRIGGLGSRIETVQFVLNNYLDGNIDKIYELEEERLDYWCDMPSGGYSPTHGKWATQYTVNPI